MTPMQLNGNIIRQKLLPGVGAPLLWLIFSLPVSGQALVTFRLDMQPLMERQLFIPARGDRVFARGDFNGWSGNGCELLPGSDSSLFSATYVLDSGPEDTLAYKFVIARGGDHFYWEVQPDRSNPPDGNRTFPVNGDSVVLPVSTFVYDEYFQYPVIFDQKKLVADFDTMRAMLERIHPALYDYTAKPELDAAFDHVRGQLHDSMEFSRYFNLLSGIMALIGCGHSHLWIPGDYWSSVPDAMFPLKMYIHPEGALVSGSYDERSKVPAGSTVLSINGEPMENIVNRLEGLTAADGFNPSYKRYRVGKEFSRKYALSYGYPDTFRLRLKAEGQDEPVEVEVRGVSVREIDRQSDSHHELSYHTLDGDHMGVLTIQTFGYYDRVEMFHAFIDSVFREIRQKGTKNLVLDVRGNAGGDPFCAAYLFSYLEHEPVPYFQEHYGQYDTLALPVPQPAGHFTGNLFTLIDGGCFSTTGHFIGLLKYHGIGRFIGEESGATFTCTGSVMYPTLEQTRIILGTARNRRYSTAVKGLDPHRGVLPDYPVYLTAPDLIKGRDPVLEQATALAK